MTSNNIVKGFLDPEKKYYPVTMWFWNDEISEDEIDFQIREFKKQNIFEFFIHPMFGFEVPYLSERFFKLIKHSVETAKKEGMKFWIYDEYNWPSGTAGGLVIKEHPETKCSLLNFLKKEVNKDEEINIEITDFVFDKLLSAVLLCEEKVIDVTNQIKINEKKVNFKNDTNKNGELNLVFKQTILHIGETTRWAKDSNWEGGYTDLMNEKAVEYYIEYTHELYKKYLGDEFGKTITGIFTDEPAVSMPRDSRFGALPWSDTMIDGFEKMFGYSILPKLYLLERNTEDDDVLAIKRDYWDYIAAAFQKNFIIKIKEWCTKNNLLLTGHFVGEEYMLLNQILFGGDFYGGLKDFDVPGMDTIFSNYYIHCDRFNTAGSMIGSLAHFAGKDRVLCETYSASGWNMSIEDMKRITNRLIFFGINLFMYMGAYYTMKGFRKVSPGCYPPSHNFHNVQFKYYNELNRYIASLCFLSSKTTQTGKTMVLHPSTMGSAVSDAYYSYNYIFDLNYNDFGTYTKQDASYSGAVNALLDLNKSAETGFEEAMNEAYIKNGKLVLGDTEYEVLVLPAIKYLRSKTVLLLEKFIKLGGKVIYINELPYKNFDSLERLEFIRADFSAYKKIEDLKNTTAENLKTEVIKLSDNQFLIISNENHKTNISKFKKAISECYNSFNVNEPIEVYSENVFANVRQNEMGYFHTIINDDNTEKLVKVKINSANDDYKCVVLNPLKSSVEAVFNANETAEIPMEGYAGKIIFTGSIENTNEFINNLTKTETDNILKPSVNAEILKDFAFKAKNDNYLRLNYSMLKDENTDTLLKDNKTLNLSDIELANYIESAENSAFIKFDETFGESWGDRAANQIAYPLLATNKRFIAKNEFVINDNIINLKLVTEDLFVDKIFINGFLLNFETVRIWDKDNLICNISDKVKKGKNIITVTGISQDWICPHCPPFMAIAGDFVLNEKNEICKNENNVKIGETITKQGYRFYFGEYEFNKKVNINDEFKSALLYCKADEIVKVSINGKFAGNIAYAPNTLDVSSYLIKGENIISLELTAKMKNIFEDEMSSGLYEVSLSLLN